MCMRYALYDIAVRALYGMEVSEQSQAEPPHAQIEERADGQQHGCGDVQPPSLEGSRVGFRGEDGVVVELADDNLVAGVAEVVDDGFELVADALYVVVGLVAEEGLDDVGRSLQPVCRLVVPRVLADGGELLGIVAVVGVVDDDFLSTWCFCRSPSSRMSMLR